MKKVDSNIEVLLKKITDKGIVSEYCSLNILENLDIFFEVLENNEDMVARCLYGLDDGMIKSYEEVANVLEMDATSVMNIDKMVLKKLKFVYSANGRKFDFNPDEVIFCAEEFLKEYQAYDSYFARSMPPEQSASTKFFKKLIKVAESHRNKNNVLKKKINY